MGAEMRMRNRTSMAHSSGSALLEVLVSVIILMFGLLGLSGLLARTHTAEFESYQRKQAVIMLEDMVGRISANPDAASCYAVSATDGSGYLGDSSTTSGSCVAGTGNPPVPSASEAARANSDVSDWSDLLKGGAEVQGTNKVGAALYARGCVVSNGAVTGFPNVTRYTVSVAWQGTTELSLPSDDTLCAKDSYSNDALRRVISVQVLVPNLN